jgi:3-deoxy-D-manno-octulosonate 8-phosphate phosphatase (KDO 8-P phosphatase)
MEITAELKEKINKIKALILDVDGILTDGKVFYSSYGLELKAFDIRDGLAINLWSRLNRPIFIITAHNSKIVRKRAKDIGINYVYQGRYKKVDVYEKIKKKFKLNDEEVCYIGDDLLDLAVMKEVGFAVTVPNAVSEAKEQALYITEKNGGEGAVREVIELILKQQNKWHEVLKIFS